LLLLDLASLLSLVRNELKEDECFILLDDDGLSKQLHDDGRFKLVIVPLRSFLSFDDDDDVLDSSSVFRCFFDLSCFFRSVTLLAEVIVEELDDDVWSVDEEEDR
jgi:hypothetical protein